MAAETMDREYLFLPVQLEERSTMEQCTAFILLNQRLNKTAAESTPNVGTFHHNYLHDIESMWWCGVWLLFFNCPKGYDEAQNDVEKRQAATVRVFPEFLAAARRLFWLTHLEKLGEALAWVREDEDFVPPVT